MANGKPDPAKLDALRQNGTLNPRPEGVTAELFQGDRFFDALDLLQVKYEMLRCVQVQKESVSQAAAAFGFSRPSFYQARFAFEENGLVGLVPQKRGPRKAHKLTAEVMEFVVQSRAARPSLSTVELAQLVQERFGVVAHSRSIERKLALGQKKR